MMDANNTYFLNLKRLGHEYEEARVERKARKQQERRDLTPASQLQPKNRGLRYENIRSAETRRYKIKKRLHLSR